ncbi:MAG: hypothetical protein SOW41_00110 [Anaerococcus sp.]|nr:hypothetical protein [Peptoniphilaceae bacterium]MDY3054443.1 hypothetical protein [Anaerococcus sp.]
MDTEKTRKYYENLKMDDLCDCAYCQNYRSKIKESYPILSAYLFDLGIDIEKPFETNPWEVEEGKLTYDPVLYLLMGNKKDFQKRKIGNVEIDISDSYPDTGQTEEHFVIGLGPIILPCEEDI